MQSLELNGVTYYQLVICYPSYSVNDHHALPAKYLHYDCGGQLYLGSNTYIYCQSCEIKEHIKNFIMTCLHKDVEYLVSKSFQLNDIPTKPITLVTIIAMAGQLVKDSGISWLVEFLENLDFNIFIY